MDLDLAETERSGEAAAGVGASAPRSRLLKADEFELRIVKDLDAAREAWLVFEEKAACTPFQTYQWMHAWQIAVSGRNSVSPLIVLGLLGDKLAFILPFAIEHWHGTRRLIWFGHELADYNGALIDPDTLKRLADGFAADILRRVRSLVPGIDYVCLAKQPETLCGLPNPFARFRSVPFTCRAHCAKLSDSWEEFSRAHRSGRSLRSFRARERHLAKLGDLVFEQASSPQERSQSMELLVTWKIAQLTARGGRVTFADAAARRFMHELARATTGDPRFRLYSLKSDGRAIALAFCLVSQGQLIYYQCAYAAGEMARYSPGSLLLIHIFKAAIDEGLEIFDFSNGDEDYKAHWVDRSDAIFVSLVPFTLKGRIAAALDRMELEAVRWVKRHPRPRAFANGLLRLWWSLKQSFAGGGRAADRARLESF